VAEKKRLPDLIFVDGGKGQLSAAQEVLENLNLTSIPVCSLAKKEEICLFCQSSRRAAS